MYFLIGIILFAGIISSGTSVALPKSAPGGTRIIGGSEASPGEIPYFVSIQTYNYVGGRYLLCGGSILSSQFVLTAAHCVYNQNVRNMEVVAGTHSIYTKEPTEQRRDIGFVKIHPTYDMLTMDGDIAVLTLSKPFILNSFIQSIALPPKDYEPSGECLNSGFGNVLNNGSSWLPTILQKVNLNILPRPTCNELYASSGGVTRGMICASVPEGGKGACHGDSGGPLTCKLESGEPYLAGTVSWGKRICALPNEPSVYANVAHYREFIDEAISD